MPNAARSAILLLVLVLQAAGCASAGAMAGSAAPTPASALAIRIEAIIDAPPLHRTSWGILITDAATGTVLYSRNAERHFIPASNMKLVVGAVALDRFGPDHRYRTELRAASRTGGDVSRLVAVGAGDPTWSARFHDTSAAVFDSMAVRVASAGIHRIGELIIDASLFRDEAVHPTWEVSDLPGIYAPPVDAFAAAEGTFRLALAGDSVVGVAGSAQVVSPLRQPLRATVLTDTAGAPTVVRTDYTARRDTIFISARVGVRVADTVTLAVTRPAESAAAAFADALQRQGVMTGSVRVVRDSAEAAQLRDGTVVVAVLASPPMVQIVEGILRSSQNWMAEQVLKTLGAEFAGEGSWRAGQTEQRRYLETVVGVDSGALVLRDASGMSAQNLLTPAATVALLDHARSQPWGEAFRSALPQPGLAGSTLSGRLQGLEGRVFAKTGTISNVNALSGYFLTDGGRDILFSVVSNGSGLPAATVRTAIDEVVRAMALHLDSR
jgi:serine-type D-Ala-D-Ala carboxypeptidase/endopeptidase (penicillin-binding protein 4)